MSNWQSVCVCLWVSCLCICVRFIVPFHDKFSLSFDFDWWLPPDICVSMRGPEGVWESELPVFQVGFDKQKSPFGIQKMFLGCLYSYDFLTFHPKGILVEIIHICGPIPDSTGIYEINSRRKFFSRFRILIYLLFIIFSSWGGKYIMCFDQILNSPQKKLPKTLSQYVWSKSILYSLKSFEIHHSLRLSGSMEHTM